MMYVIYFMYGMVNVESMSMYHAKYTKDQPLWSSLLKISIYEMDHVASRTAHHIHKCFCSLWFVRAWLDSLFSTKTERVNATCGRMSFWFGLCFCLWFFPRRGRAHLHDFSTFHLVNDAASQLWPWSLKNPFYRIRVVLQPRNLRWLVILVNVQDNNTYLHTHSRFSESLDQWDLLK